MAQNQDFSLALLHAQTLLQEGRYGSCIKECGSLLEAGLKRLYQQLLLKVPAERLQELRELEACVLPGKTWESMGLGQLLGLFHRAQVFNWLESQNKGPGKHLKNLNLNQVNDLRNQVTHRLYQPLESETHLAYYTLSEFLRLTQLVENLPSKGPDTQQHFSGAELYAYVLRLVPDPAQVSVAVRKVLDDIAVELDLSLKAIRSLEQNAQIHPYLKSEKSFIPTKVSSYAAWLARSKSATQYAVRFYKMLCNEIEGLEIDFTHPEVIRYLGNGISWMELSPSINGFIFHLADPDFQPPDPSAWFQSLRELLATMEKTSPEFYVAPVWDPDYDQGHHPIRFQIPTDWMHEYTLLELLAENYNLFIQVHHK